MLFQSFKVTLIYTPPQANFDKSQDERARSRTDNSRFLVPDSRETNKKTRMEHLLFPFVHCARKDHRLYCLLFYTQRLFFCMWGTRTSFDISSLDLFQKALPLRLSTSYCFVNLNLITRVFYLPTTLGWELRQPLRTRKIWRQGPRGASLPRWWVVRTGPETKKHLTNPSQTATKLL